MPHTLIISPLVDSSTHARDDAVRVATPLDAILRLEEQPTGTIVLVGENATNTELADFIGEFYPSVRIQREGEVGDVARR